MLIAGFSSSQRVFHGVSFLFVDEPSGFRKSRSFFYVIFGFFKKKTQKIFIKKGFGSAPGVVRPCAEHHQVRKCAGAELFFCFFFWRGRENLQVFHEKMSNDLVKTRNKNENSLLQSHVPQVTFWQFFQPSFTSFFLRFWGFFYFVLLGRTVKRK